MTRNEALRNTGISSFEDVKKMFEAKKAANEEERRKEAEAKLPTPANPKGLAIIIFAFLDAEAEAYLACSGTARYQLTEKQMFYLKWYDSKYPTTELRALINEAEENPVCIYDWRNLQVLMTELVEDFRAAQQMQLEAETQKNIELDKLPAHIRARLEAKIK